MQLIDTHCHLYAAEFNDEIGAVLSRATQGGVAEFYMPAIDSETHAQMITLEKEHPGCFSMMGLHPCSVKAGWEKEMEIVENWLTKRKFAAIGEAGLDFYWDKTFIKEQYLVLEKQIALALNYQLPLVLHTRNAMQETLDIIKQYKNTSLTGIFHCFGGTHEEAQQVIELGFYLGIGGVLTYKKSGLDEVIKKIDLSHIVLETDAPYLSPVPYRGKRNESAYIIEVAKKLAAIKEIPIEEVAAVTSMNAKKIFKNKNV